MRIRKAIIAVLCVAFVIGSGGCRRNPSGLDALKPGRGDITDPAELERLWQDYLYDSIGTIWNSGDFTSAAEIDPLNVAEYCWFKYIDEHGPESLEPAGPDTWLRLLPLTAVLTYAERYFGVTSLDMTGISPDLYDPQRQAFLFAMDHRSAQPSYNEKNSWGCTLARATRGRDGTVTTMLTQSIQGHIVLIKTYTLKPRQDGSLCFVSGRREYINNHLVSITGDCRRFDGISGWGGSQYDLTLLGEADGRWVIASTPRDESKNSSLMLVQPRTMSVEKGLEVSERFGLDADLTVDGIVVRLMDRVVVVDTGLKQAIDIPLPDSLAGNVGQEYFRGYDVSPDRQRYVYADRTGVRLLSAVDGRETSLERSPGAVYGSPRFVAGGQKVIATVCGYDGPTGYTLWDLATGTAKTYGTVTGGTSTDIIRHDAGLLEVNAPVFDGKQDHQTVYLDFASGDATTVVLPDRGDTGTIPSPAYVGRNYAAFVTHKLDVHDNANSVYFINRLNLKTLQVEPAVITVKAAEPYILGVLDDGRIVFSYDLNPSERGICITK